MVCGACGRCQRRIFVGSSEERPIKGEASTPLGEHNVDGTANGYGFG